MLSIWEQWSNVHQPLKNRNYLGKKLFFNFLGQLIHKKFFIYILIIPNLQTLANGWGHFVFWKQPWNPGILVFNFTPRNSRQNKAPPLETPQNCVTPRPKTKTPASYAWFLLDLPWIFGSFLLTPRNSTCYFFNTPGNSKSSSPLFFFFSGIAQ